LLRVSNDGSFRTQPRNGRDTSASAPENTARAGAGRPELLNMAVMQASHWNHAGWWPGTRSIDHAGKGSLL